MIDEHFNEIIYQPTFSGMEPEKQPQVHNERKPLVNESNQHPGDGQEDDMIPDISVCWVHSVSLDDECDFCEAEMVARDWVLSTLNDSLSARGKQLASQGGGIDPSSIVDARLNILLDVIFGDDVRQRMRYEHEFARHMTIIFDEADRQIRMHQITEAAKQSSTLHLPGNQ